MTETKIDELIRGIERMNKSIDDMRDDFAANNNQLVQAVIGQDRVPVSTLNKIVDANSRERKLWMGAVTALITALILAVRSAHAEPLYGPDALAGKHYQKQIIRAVQPGSAGGIFLRTFGDARTTVKAMACSDKFAEIVVHLATFDKTHAYPIAKLRSQVLADARWLEQNVATKCSAKLMLSPFCEHNHKARDMLPLFADLRKAAPSTLMVNAIWRGEQVPNTITEIHIPDARGPPKKPKGEYVVSFDGFGGDGSGDFPDADIPSLLARYSDARHIRYWNFRFNGKYGHNDTTPIAERKHWPDVRYIRGHAATMKQREGGITWPKTALYKTFADDHGNEGPTKDNKAMAILPVDKPAVDVFDSRGKKIDRMIRYRPDSPNPKGARYYSPRYAFQIANDAKKNTGSALIRIDKMPPTDGYLRSNPK